MKDIKNFQERYNRWKNGERYWDIRGVELPKYNTGKQIQKRKMTSILGWINLLIKKHKIGQKLQ